MQPWQPILSGHKYREIVNKDNSRVHLGDNHVHYHGDESGSILSELSGPEFGAIHRQLQERRLPDTGSWFLKHPRYLKWIAGDSHTLWCPGLPGAGKTFLASTIVDDLNSRKDPSWGVVYLYSQHNQRSQQSVSAFLASVACQLIQLVPNSSKYKCLEDVHLFLHTRDVRSPASLQKLLLRLLEEFACTFLILDALDEFSMDDDERLKMVKALVSIRNEANPSTDFRICITSRESSTAPLLLASFEEIRIRSSREDIEEFVSTRIDSSQRLTKWIKRDPVLGERIVVAIMEKSDRIFKLAELQIESLCKQMSILNLNRALGHLSREIDEYYRQALARIDEKTDYQAWIKKLFAWVLYARRRVRSANLSHLLAIESGMSGDIMLEDLDVDVQSIVSMSEGLIICPSQDSEDVVFAHETIDDFLRRNETWLGFDGKELVLETSLTAMVIMENVITIDLGKLSYDNDYYWNSLESLRLVRATCADFIYDNVHDFRPAVSYDPAVWRRVAVRADPKAILLCCATGDLYQTIETIAFIRNVNDTFCGRTLLHVAIAQNEPERVRLLLGRPGINLNCSDINGYRPLHIAASYGLSTRCLPPLLDHPAADVNIRDSHGCTPMMFGIHRRRCWRDYTLIMPYYKADFSAFNACGFNVLHIIVANSPILGENTSAGNVDLQSTHNLLYNILGIAGLDVNVPDDNGHTPLHLAVHNTDEGAVRLLLDAENVNVNATNNGGHSILSWLIQNLCWPGRVTIWESRRSDMVVDPLFLRLAHYCRTTQLHARYWADFASTGNKLLVILEMMLEFSHIDVNTLDHEGHTALDWARYYCSVHETALATAQKNGLMYAQIPARMRAQIGAQRIEQAATTVHVARTAVQMLKSSGARALKTPNAGSVSQVDWERAELVCRISSPLLYDCTQGHLCECATFSGHRHWPFGRRNKPTMADEKAKDN